MTRLRFNKRERDNSQESKLCLLKLLISKVKYKRISRKTKNNEPVETEAERKKERARDIQ